MKSKRQKLLNRPPMPIWRRGLVRELRARGYQAKDFTLLAYGGNGPLHCCGIATQAGIKRVLAPPYSSVFSACGGAAMNQLHIHEKTETVALYNQHTKQIFQDYDYFNSIAEELEERGRADLIRQGIDEKDIQYRLELDLRLRHPENGNLDCC